MATPVRLVHSQTGLVRTGFFGFSWTSFWFGGFPALLRGDLGYGLGVLAAGVVFGALSAGLLWFAVSVAWAAIYNKNFTQRLLESGYRFDDTPERVAQAKRALGVAG